MTDSMIEKVAAALCFADNGYGHEDRRNFYLPMAKAAIAAMREPTTEMECSDYDPDDCATPDAARSVWIAMIDAALSEPSDHA